MSRARIRVVGLGPGDARYVTAGTAQALRDAPVARLRTNVHPAAAEFDIESYDPWYESAHSFEELYARIVEDLVDLARTSPNLEVVYAVPGSPVVAEHTVELLRERSDVDVVCEPAVSVIDVACAALGVDPMQRGLRILDALDSTEPFRGPGPLLILQTYSPEVLATVADRLPEECEVDVLHHLGLDDESIVRLRARDLASFLDADHLTSLYVEGLRTAGEAMDDLVSFTRRLREECPWDQEQTHASLTKYLLEESYEALDALNNLAAMIDAGEEDATLVAHAEEELGDLLFQVLFHAELGDEESRFNLASIADLTRDKLTARHPHVFDDVVVENAGDVAVNWEVIKKAEKGRTSVIDGIAWDLPSLALYVKVLKKARSLGITNEAVIGDLLATVSTLGDVHTSAIESDSEPDEETYRTLIEHLVVIVAMLAGDTAVDLESAVRREVLRLRDQILAIEASHRDSSKDAE